MMKTKFVNPEGLENLHGRVNAKFRSGHLGYFVDWICPYCHERCYLDAIKFMIDFCIEDSRTAFANCNGVDYAIILPRDMPPDLFKAWNKERAH